MSMNKALRGADSKAYRRYAATKPKDATPPITFGAHSTTRDYAGNNMQSSRGDANDNLLVGSRFSGAQITRVV